VGTDSTGRERRSNVARVIWTIRLLDPGPHVNSTENRFVWTVITTTSAGSNGILKLLCDISGGYVARSLRDLSIPPDRKLQRTSHIGVYLT
jgi:hypothetical protein